MRGRAHNQVMRGLSPSRLLGGEQEPTYLEAAAHTGTHGWEPEDRQTEITARMAPRTHRGDTPAWLRQRLPRLPRAKPTSPFPDFLRGTKPIYLHNDGKLYCPTGCWVL